jgi:hypothetical protein
MRSFVVLAGCAMMLSACASGASPASSAAFAPAVRQASTGNIYWSKGKLKLQYQGGKKEVVLNFWAPNGYMAGPMYCKNGSQIAVAHNKAKGNPAGYEHVTYSFKAESSGPDTCSYDAVLSNTGSPPIAILHLTIGS